MNSLSPNRGRPVRPQTPVTGLPMLQAQQPQSYFTQNPYGPHPTQLQQPYQPPPGPPPQQQLLTPQPQPLPPPQASSRPSRRHRRGSEQQAQEANLAPLSMPPLKNSRINEPWTPAEEQRLKVMRDAGNSWGEISKDMHSADFDEDDSAALLAAIKKYEASKWKVIGQKIGKPAKACELYAKENFRGKIMEHPLEEKSPSLLKLRAPVAAKNRKAEREGLGSRSIVPCEVGLDLASRMNDIHPSDDIMSLVKSQVLDGLPKVLGPIPFSAMLTMDWDLLGFMKNQYPDKIDANIGSVITLSGTVVHAQATTCSEYAQQTWPSQGLKVVMAFQSAIDNREHKASVLINNLDIDIELKRKFCVLKFDSDTLNNSTTVAEVFQQALWMGAALRVSENQRVQYSTFELRPIGVGGKSQFWARYGTSKVSEEEQCCWLPIFTNPVIARGFPVPERKNGEQGLEVPLEIMAALGGARHVTDFEGGLVLKGYSAMFMPTERHHESVQWHLIRSSDEKRILYRKLRTKCPNRAMLEEVDYESLKTKRAFLGWWKSSETHLGTGDAAYESIDWSPAGEAKRLARFSGANIGFQTMITGQLNFIMGAKDGRLHFSQKGPFQRIVQCAENTPVVLYDLQDRRAWLVPALDVMLHVIQTRHHLSPYNIDGQHIDLTPLNPEKGRGAATEAVAANQLQQLYERDVATEKVYRFKDAILDIWSQIERLMEKEDSVEALPGLPLHGTMQSKVHGWEFMSLVHEKNYRRKEVTIAKSSGGWVDLVTDIDALVLLATSFGEIIRPVRSLRRLCHQWKSLPKNKDYLAAGVPILELLYSEAGSRLSRRHLSTTHLQWHRGSTLFERCSNASADRCKCDRTQQIYHDSLFKTIGQVRPPGQLEENGCVIFGQAHHPFKPTRTVAIRENAVHILANTSIQNDEVAEKISTRDSSIKSPSPPTSISPDPEEVNAYAIRSPKRPPSLLSLSDDLVQDKPVASKRRRGMSHAQISNSDTCDRTDERNEQISIPNDCAVCPAEYQSMLKYNIRPKGPFLVSTHTACSSKAISAPVDSQKMMNRKAEIEDHSHPYGCSCTACLMVDFEPPGSIELVRTTNDARETQRV